MLHHVVDWEQALGEAARVLRPDGQLISDDLVADGLGGVHAKREHGTRRMRSDELGQRLAALPFENVFVKKSAGSLVVRFAATRERV